MADDLEAVGALFEIPGHWLDGSPWGSGHINDTHVVRYRAGGRVVRFVHQRINEAVFPDPASLMENIERVTAHQRRKLREAGADQIERRVLELVPARSGGSWCRDRGGSAWRTYRFVEGARTYDQVASTAQAREAARAYGVFQRHLADLPAPPLNETIPDFHHTRRRFEALLDAVRRDPHGRVRAARAEIAFIEARAELVDRLLDLARSGAMPERVTHNDTKINNVLLDDRTGEGLCVLDLDTVMPGLALYDFGDLVRTAATRAAEDERDLAKAQVELELFEALVEGYLAETGPLLTQAELDQLAFSGVLITLEMSMRFLTDHLEGDTYFKIHRPAHNLERCRAQLRLLESMEAQRDALEAVVARYRPR
jgi:Ser/Thr protein kinase RdoA (MazF antagonist)